MGSPSRVEICQKYIRYISAHRDTFTVAEMTDWLRENYTYFQYSVRGLTTILNKKKDILGIKVDRFLPARVHQQGNIIWKIVNSIPTTTSG